MREFLKIMLSLIGLAVVSAPLPIHGALGADFAARRAAARALLVASTATATEAARDREIERQMRDIDNATAGITDADERDAARQAAREVLETAPDAALVRQAATGQARLAAVIGALAQRRVAAEGGGGVVTLPQAIATVRDEFEALRGAAQPIPALGGPIDDAAINTADAVLTKAVAPAAAPPPAAPPPAAAPAPAVAPPAPPPAAAPVAGGGAAAPAAGAVAPPAPPPAAAPVPAAVVVVAPQPPAPPAVVPAPAGGGAAEAAAPPAPPAPADAVNPLVRAALAAGNSDGAKAELREIDSNQLGGVLRGEPDAIIRQLGITIGLDGVEDPDNSADDIRGAILDAIAQGL